MITERTVFILGAGASHPYNMPLGFELYQQVVNNFGGDTQSRNELRLANFPPELVMEFNLALRYSGLRSVDAFLEKRQEFIEVGKAAMAIELIHREAYDYLWSAERGWMTYLLGYMMTETFEDFWKNQVCFITYNYDRSLETFLTVSLSNIFKKTHEYVSQAMPQLPIIHLHGQLGWLPWERQPSRAYGEQKINRQVIEDCVRKMKIVHEDIMDRDAEFQQTIEFMQKASRIYMMGFGFGAQNVKRLEFDKVQIAPKNFMGTGFGLTDREKGAIGVMCNQKVLLQNRDCLDFLRHHAILQ